MIVFLLSFSFQSFSSDYREPFSVYEDVKTISKGKYIVGGVFGFVLGFGIGHAIQGRYAERGWIFTLGNLSLISGLSGAVFFGVGAKYQPDNKLIYGVAHACLGLGLIGLGISLWEKIDIWLLPSHYKIVKESPVKIKPLAFYDSKKQLYYGLSLNYHF